MKMNSRKTAYSLVLGAVMAANAILPVTVFAQEQTPAQKGFCSRFPEFVQRLDQRIADRQARIETRRTERLQNLENRRNARDTRRTEAQERRQENFAEHIAKLEARAATDAQKQAVVNFRAAVETAIAVRKTALNAAVKTFRDGVDQTIAQRKTAVDTAINAFKNARQAAVDKVETDCASGINSETVRETFRADMKTAREKFISDGQAIEKFYASIQPLIDVRRQAFDKSRQEFRAAMEKARADLKAAFGA